MYNGLLWNMSTPAGNHCNYIYIHVYIHVHAHSTGNMECQQQYKHIVDRQGDFIL